MNTEVADPTNLSEKKDFLVRSSSLKDVRSFSREVFEKFKIDEDLGLSTGFRVGREWRYFFADFQLSYLHNNLSDLNAGIPSVPFSGESRGFGGYFTLGGKLPISKFWNLYLGVGLGGINKEVTFRLMDMSVEEKTLCLHTNC